MFKWNLTDDIDEIVLAFWPDEELATYRGLDKSFSRAYRHFRSHGHISHNCARTRKMWKRHGTHRMRRAHKRVAMGKTPRNIRPVTGWDVD